MGIGKHVNRWYQQYAYFGMTTSKSGTAGRPRINAEKTMARFPEGTLGRLKAVLRDGENQSDFMREPGELELRRREGPPVGGPHRLIGRASCRERGCQYVLISVFAETVKQKRN